MLRKLLALPLLPAEHIQPAFTGISSTAVEDDAVDQLLTYVSSTWLDSTVWSTENLSVYGQHVRTNNDVEGWHRRLNQRARRADLPFYLLVRVLHEEASMVSLQVRLLSDGKLRRQSRKKYRELNGRLLTLWREYAAGERTTSSLLRAASRLQLPNVFEL